MYQRILGLVILAVILWAVGCSKNVKVSGKVTFPDDTPVTIGKVTFETDSFVASGPLKEDGTYIIGSLSARDGLPPGLYKVYIAGAMRQEGTRTMWSPDGTSVEIPVAAPVVAKKYTKADTSGIVCDVKKSVQFDFKVEPPE